jgi:hypothetical protein
VVGGPFHVFRVHEVIDQNFIQGPEALDSIESLGVITSMGYAG